MMSNNAGSLIEMAICGAGIVMMPDWVVADEIRTGKLVAILTDTPVSSDNQEICVAILTPQSAYRPVNVQAVMDFFVEKWDGGRSWGFQAGWNLFFAKFQMLPVLTSIVVKSKFSIKAFLV